MPGIKINTERTCPECLRPRGVMRGRFIPHYDGNGQPCPGSGRPAATRSGGEETRRWTFRFSSRKDGRE